MELLSIQVCGEPTPMHCSTGQGKVHLPLFSAALQNRLTAGLCHCNHTYGDLLSIQVCSEPTPMHFSTGQGKVHFPLLSAALQNRLTAGLFHCNSTYGHLLFIQMCSEATKMQCSTGQGKVHFPLFSSALQNRVTAGSVSPQLHLWRCALHTGVQSHRPEALQLCLGQNGVPTVQRCSAKQDHSRQCVTALPPLQICSSNKCAVTQQQSNAALFRAKCSFHCSVLLCKTGSQQAVCHCAYTYGGWLFI